MHIYIDIYICIVDDRLDSKMEGMHREMKARSHDHDSYGDNDCSKTEASEAHSIALWRLFDRIALGDTNSWNQLFDIACQDGEYMARAIAAVCVYCNGMKVVDYSTMKSAANVFGRMSLHWIETSVKDGCKYALFLRAMFFFKGICGEKNFETARELCDRSAKQGFLPAQHMLFRYEIKYGEEAARSGYALSQYALALQFTYIALPDYITAAMWFQKAADQGVSEAMVELAKLYFNGRGVPKDIAQAFCLVTRSNNSASKEVAAHLEVHLRQRAGAWEW
jgi:TPR repeat protein